MEVPDYASIPSCVYTVPALTSDRILGAHIVGYAGEELIHVFAFAMKFGITASQINHAVFAFPTFSDDIKHML